MGDLLVVLAGGGLIGYLLREVQHRREIAVKMIEIAVGVLADKPDAGSAALRDWAVDVIASYSKVSLSPEVRAALRNKPLPVLAEATGSAAGRSRARGLGAVDNSGEVFQPVHTPPGQDQGAPDRTA